MKIKQAIILVLVFLGTVLVNSCSKCYECSEEVLVEDGNGVVIDTVYTEESVCTADQDEIAERERNGATCR